MLKDFKEFNFEVIDVSTKGTPDIFVNLNGVTFTKKAIETIGFPPYVRPLIDVENKAFAVQVCKQNDEKAISFSKPRGEQINGVSVQLLAVLRTIRTIMRDKWQENNRYRIAGIYYPEAKAMVFDLNSAEEMPAFRLTTKQK